MALFAAASLCTAPAASGNASQDSGTTQAASATLRGAGGGKLPLRVMLVISEAVRGYKVHEGFVHIDFGGRLAKQAEKNFDETFASVQTAAAAPTEALAPGSIDLIVSIESARGWDKFSGFSATETLTAVFVARRPGGEEILRIQESASEDGNRAATQDRLGDAISRKFIQEMLLSPGVRELIAHDPAVSSKAERSDSSMLGSRGLELPPPPLLEITARAGDAARADQLGLDERP